MERISASINLMVKKDKNASHNTVVLQKDIPDMLIVKFSTLNKTSNISYLGRPWRTKPVSH